MVGAVGRVCSPMTERPRVAPSTTARGRFAPGMVDLPPFSPLGRAMSAPNPIVTVGNVRFGNALPLALIAGPCQLESRAHALEMASALKEIAGRLGIGLVYKTSFDKANRTSAAGRARHRARGVAADLRRNPRDAGACRCSPTCTRRAQCARVAQAVDVLQIPAFLCRQTDLLVAAAETGRAVNVKKGQFLAPWDMANVGRQGHRRRQPQRAGDRARRLVRLQHAGLRHARAARAGADRRAGDLRRDAFGAAAGRAGRPSSGGQREFVPVLARAAVAVGVAGVFIETHQDPGHARRPTGRT